MNLSVIKMAYAVRRTFVVEKYWMDLSYGFYQYPIVSYSDNETLLSKENVVKECKNLNLSIDKILAEMPEDKRISHIVGYYSGQCSVEDMFKTFDFDSQMIGYGDSEIALLITKKDQYTSWIEFNFREISKESVNVFKELITSLQKVTETRLAISISKKEGYIAVPLDNYDKIIEELGNKGKFKY